jgi:hypothetical protein
LTVDFTLIGTAPVAMSDAMDAAESDEVEYGANTASSETCQLARAAERWGALVLQIFKQAAQHRAEALAYRRTHPPKLPRWRPLRWEGLDGFAGDDQ